MGLRPTTGMIDPASPRASDWQRIFGSLEVPLRSPVPVLADSPAGRQRFYLVAVERLEPQQIERLVGHLASKFGVPPAEVNAGLHDPDHGCPILADDVSVAFDARLLL